MRQRDRQKAVLQVSRAAVELFAAHGYTETTVRQIADAAGVSVRSFHRFFATKEDAVSPVLDAGWESFVEAFAARPADEPIADGLVAAFAISLESAAVGQPLTFLRSLPKSPALEPIWQHAVDRCRAALQPVLASRLGLEPDSIRAKFTAACVVAGTRTAVETLADDEAPPVLDVTRDCLALIDAALLVPLSAATKHGPKS